MGKQTAEQHMQRVGDALTQKHLQILKRMDKALAEEQKRGARVQALRETVDALDRQHRMALQKIQDIHKTLSEDWKHFTALLEAGSQPTPPRPPPRQSGSGPTRPSGQAHSQRKKK